MNIQEACAKRINERRAQHLARQRANELEHQAKIIREEYAADLIRAWIARVYSLDLDMTQLVVREQNADHFSLSIVFDGDSHIEAMRVFEINSINVAPTPFKQDMPDCGSFAELWRAVHENYVARYDDLIDAVIDATDAENTLSQPELSEAQPDEMFPISTAEA